MGKHRVGALPGNDDHPTNPDLWGKDQYYEPDDRPRKAAWAVALCLTVVVLVVGGIGFMFGMGRSSADTSDMKIITTTVTPAAGPRSTVTVKSQPKPRVTVTKVRPSLMPGPTVYRTVPAPAVTKIVKVQPKPNVTKTVTAVATVTERACFSRSMIEIECP